MADNTVRLSSEVISKINNLDERLKTVNKSASVGFSYLYNKFTDFEKNTEHFSYIADHLKDNYIDQQGIINKISEKLTENSLNIDKHTNYFIDLIEDIENIKKEISKFNSKYEEIKEIENKLNDFIVLPSNRILIERKESKFKLFFKSIKDSLYKFFHKKQIKEEILRIEREEKEAKERLKKEREEKERLEKIEKEKEERENKLKEIKRQQDAKNKINTLLKGK